MQDFIDLGHNEKEYLQEWDAFVLRKHISSEQYLPRHFLRFVREKAAWMAAKPSRAEEFSLHVATLLARRVLPDAVIVEATQLLNDARSRKAAGEGGAEELASATTTRSKASGGCCCACGTPVAVPAMLVCVNKVSHFCSLRTMDANRYSLVKECENRLYHDSCVENPEEAVANRKHWKCKACS